SSRTRVWSLEGRPWSSSEDRQPERRPPQGRARGSDHFGRPVERGATGAQNRMETAIAGAQNGAHTAQNCPQSEIPGVFKTGRPEISEARTWDSTDALE